MSAPAPPSPAECAGLLERVFARAELQLEEEVIESLRSSSPTSKSDLPKGAPDRKRLRRWETGAPLLLSVVQSESQNVLQT